MQSKIIVALLQCLLPMKATWNSFSFGGEGRSSSFFDSFDSSVGPSSSLYSGPDDFRQGGCTGFFSGGPDAGMSQSDYEGLITNDGSTVPWTPKPLHQPESTITGSEKSYTGNTDTSSHSSIPLPPLSQSMLASDFDMKAIVESRYGAILGNVYEKHRTFLGIPYAVPPVGPNRWRRAIPLMTYTQEFIDAREYGNHCMQLDTWGSDYIRNFILGMTTKESEDCLNLNIYTPTKARLSKLRSHKVPVMVFVHGGTFTTGGTSAPIYDAANFVKGNDVLVVTFHYRMSIWGCLASKELAEDDEVVGNYAVTDVLAVLQWVKRHISAFGGDPKNVTLAGHSAGAALVNYVLLALSSDGYRNLELVHRVILFSGSTGCALNRFLDEADIDLTIQPTFDVLAREAGCGDAEDKVECLRQVDPFDLAAIGIKNKWEYHWGPVIDGNYFHGMPADQVRKGNFYAVPMLVTDCLDDGTIFSTGEDTTTYEGYVNVIRKYFGTDAAPSIAAYYGPTPNCDGTSYFKAASDLLRDALITCPLDEMGSAIIESGLEDSIWYFRFSTPLSMVWLATSLPGIPDYGVFHGTELVLLFQGLPQLNLGQSHVVNHVQRRIVAFMNGSKPDDPKYPKENPAKQIRKRYDIDRICSQWARWPLSPEFIEVKMGLRGEESTESLRFSDFKK